MKPSLQLKLSQSLTMTPQLQQAIRLLQLSSMELQTEIQEALDSNMMLELAEEDAETAPAEEAAAEPDGEDGDAERETTVLEDDIPQDLPVDTGWDDIYDGALTFRRPGGDGEYTFENQDTQEKTLSDHLLWQLNLTPTSETDRAIAVAIIDALDDDGYLTCPLEEIRDPLASDVKPESEEVEAVLRLVQAMEPS